MNEFKESLLGHYSNKDQAWANPSKWSYVHLLFEESSDGFIYSYSWYDYLSKNQAYRTSKHTIEQQGDLILLNTYTKLNTNCPIAFSYSDGYWNGICYECIIDDNAYLTTQVKFNGSEYYTRDGAYDRNTHQFLWGKKKTEPMFHFKLIRK